MRTDHSEEFEQLRNKLGLSLNEVADVIGVTKAAITHWQAGRRQVPETVMRLMRFFDENPSDIEYFKQFRSE